MGGELLRERTAIEVTQKGGVRSRELMEEEREAATIKTSVV